MNLDLGYEAGFRELELAVGVLEGGELGLDDSLKAFEQGVRLLAYLNSLLDGAERTVAILQGDGANGTLNAIPFDATATTSTPPPPADDLPF